MMLIILGVIGKNCLNIDNSAMLGSQDFNNLHKTAYSHGLESIYSIENIDLRTLRRLQENPLQTEVPPKKRIKPLKKDSQLELDLGVGFRNWIAPFFPLESIRVLRFSKAVEKGLWEQGKRRIGDLLDLTQIKGFGQGHLVEIADKMANHIGGRNPKKAETIDFTGWLFALFASLELKRLIPLLEKYQLQDLVAITPAESVEIKRLNQEQREEWCRNLLKEVDLNLLKEGCKAISYAFLIPWMFERAGIASRDEIEERLERVAEEGEIALKVLKLLDDCFGKGFFFATHLTPLTGDLYTINPMYACFGNAMFEISSTYFYANNTHYPLKSIVSLIKRELATEWVAFPEKFIEKILYTAPHFRLLRNFRGEILVFANSRHLRRHCFEHGKLDNGCKVLNQGLDRSN